VADTDLEDGWRLELQPTLVELANHLRKRPPSDRPVSVPVGPERISVTPAEREVLLRTAERGGAGLARHLLLVSDGLVIRARLIEDQAELAAASEEAAPQAAAKVRYDIDMGFKVVRAMQGEMAVLMSTGRVEHGRRLAEHRGFVSGALLRANRRLAQAGFETAQGASQGAGTDGGASPSRGSAGTNGTQLPKWVPSVVAGLLFVLLAALLLQLWVTRVRDLPQVGPNDFAFLPGVETVACRPPGVILVVPGDRWARLNNAARVQAVENAVLVVEHLGYRRLQIRTKTGNVLGEWRKGDGVSVRR